MTDTPCRYPAPSVFLPPLQDFAAQSPDMMNRVLKSLRELYWPAWFAERETLMDLSKSRRPEAAAALLPSHGLLRSAASPRLPDSGYASAEEEDECGGENEAWLAEKERVRADASERAYAVRWLTGLIACSDTWRVGDTEKAHIVDEAAALLARCADTHADGALARRFVFDGVAVELWDETYADDPSGVGLQTWGSAWVLAARVCADPSVFGLGAGQPHVRVLELGAGTGLLSLAVAARCPHAAVVATDFHPAVLANLRRNVARNAAAARVRVETLDWARPPAVDAADTFDVVLAADVIYDARHGALIRRCAARLLRREGGVMWMIVPRRPTRGQEIAGVEDVFAGSEEELEILHVEDVERQRGVGRADEPSYRLFKIGWRRDVESP